jgi:hypothetical protein
MPATSLVRWETTSIAAQTQERNRGRDETRHLKILPAPTDLPFPHATQVLLLERNRPAGDSSQYAPDARPRVVRAGSRPPAVGTVGADRRTRLPRPSGSSGRVRRVRRSLRSVPAVQAGTVRVEV